MVATRQLKRVGSERWLFRTDRGDYGPITTDQVLDAIREHKIDLATQVSVTGTNTWTVAGEFALFREHYAVCERRWDDERLRAQADAMGRRIERRGHATRHAGRLVAVLVVVGLGFGGWVAWRLMKAEPLGLARIVRPLSVAPLPSAPPNARTVAMLPVVKDHKVARLAEPESYDTAGIAIDGGAVPPEFVTQMHFSLEGEVQMISAADLARVVESARQGLYGCAREAATRGPSFAGTDVAFTVASGHLAGVSAGAEARRNAPFLACIKAALARVKVPEFAGSERRGTVPLRFQP